MNRAPTVFLLAVILLAPITTAGPGPHAIVRFIVERAQRSRSRSTDFG